MTQKNKSQKVVEEFNNRIKNYDTLNFLKEGNVLTSIMNNMIKIDQKTIAELTSKQLQALPLRR